MINGHQPDQNTKIFLPRPSQGWVWLCALGTLFLIITIIYALTPLPITLQLFLVIVMGLIAILFLLLASWFPTIRYELSENSLTLIYGPVLRYVIDIKQIKTIQRCTLAFNPISSCRMPGVALFTVLYSDVGSVKMCATAMLNDILLIETDSQKYGLTPLEEMTFITELKRRMMD